MGSFEWKLLRRGSPKTVPSSPSSSSTDAEMPEETEDPEAKATREHRAKLLDDLPTKWHATWMTRGSAKLRPWTPTPSTSRRSRSSLSPW